MEDLTPGSGGSGGVTVPTTRKSEKSRRCRLWSPEPTLAFWVRTDEHLTNPVAGGASGETPSSPRWYVRATLEASKPRKHSLHFTSTFQISVRECQIDQNPGFKRSEGSIILVSLPLQSGKARRVSNQIHNLKSLGHFLLCLLQPRGTPCMTFSLRKQSLL